MKSEDLEKERQRLHEKFDQKRRKLVEDLYEVANRWMIEEAHRGKDEEAALLIGLMAFSEVCGMYAATYAFLNKKCDVWAEMCVDGATNNFRMAYYKELNTLTDHAEDENGNVKKN